MVCPACEQEDVHRLPVYTAESFAWIRIEACDVCHAFIKTIDLTKDGRAIPVVDEIASLPLTLWAEEKGYKKLQRNVLLI
jgi:formate dehydrogenase maturation protein FdhE